MKRYALVKTSKKNNRVAHMCYSIIFCYLFFRTL
nr:MAG TPA: hypothetical protein [Caudoviricetes sp.]